MLLPIETYRSSKPPLFDRFGEFSASSARQPDRSGSTRPRAAAVRWRSFIARLPRAELVRESRTEEVRVELIEAVVLVHQGGARSPSGAHREVEGHRSASSVALIDVLVRRVDPEAGPKPGAESHREGRTIALREVRDYGIVGRCAVMDVIPATQRERRAHRVLAAHPEIPYVLVILVEDLRRKLLEYDRNRIEQLPVSVLHVAQQGEPLRWVYCDAGHELIGKRDLGRSALIGERTAGELGCEYGIDRRAG